MPRASISLIARRLGSSSLVATLVGCIPPKDYAHHLSGHHSRYLSQLLTALCLPAPRDSTRLVQSQHVRRREAEIILHSFHRRSDAILPPLNAS